MTLLSWHHANRTELAQLLPEAIVVLPVGATEQHGPHLATGTDWILAQSVSEHAATLVHERSPRPLVLVPPVPFGASDHHLPFGGTLSLSPETLLAVLLDLARSLHADGGRRLVLVNGHGGNVGVCHAAAAAASTRYDVNVAHVDYWRLARDCDVPVPGHAGAFETALMLAQNESFVAERKERPDPPTGDAVDDVALHTAESWQRIDGYTDRPELADPATGRKWFDQVAAALGDRLLELAEVL
ncbi:creatinine amidohydrolase [Kribbella sp. VKM Ac-2571]|uniref:creatininase family protein n=1 Tax=Kribbella sp. VKM Ac-2571 TaxID=2512222 RepID=UPI00105D9B54|nr:creatininase family protein [Kribbella sp. VKM Ac-2571]TDO69507.1 creatinine amidohydrolase [Kribbella sp. VKM Ac-2571]